MKPSETPAIWLYKQYWTISWNEKCFHNIYTNTKIWIWTSCQLQTRYMFQMFAFHEGIHKRQMFIGARIFIFITIGRRSTVYRGNPLIAPHFADLRGWANLITGRFVWALVFFVTTHPFNSTCFLMIDSLHTSIPCRHWWRTSWASVVIELGLAVCSAIINRSILMKILVEHVST